MSEARSDLLAELRDACEEALWNGEPTDEQLARIARIEQELRNLMND